MDRRIVEINLSAVGRLEAGSVMLSYIAYPRIDEDAARQQNLSSLMHGAYKAYARITPEWADSRQPIMPKYALLPDVEFKRGLRQFNRRIQDRQLSGRMAVPFLHRTLGGEPLVMPKPMKRLNVTELARLFLEDSRETDPVNVVKGAWSGSKPVLHLTSALEVYWRKAPERNRPGEYEDLQHLEGALEEVIALAEEHRTLLAADERLKLDPAAFIVFELRK